MYSLLIDIERNVFVPSLGLRYHYMYIVIVEYFEKLNYKPITYLKQRVLRMYFFHYVVCDVCIILHGYVKKKNLVV